MILERDLTIVPSVLYVVRTLQLYDEGLMQPFLPDPIPPIFAETIRTMRLDLENMARMLPRAIEAGVRIVSGGTENHVMLVDVGSVGLSGAAAEDALHRVNITCNKNLIPFDERPPMEASGIRLGTAAITTRGLDEEDMASLAGWIRDVLRAPEDDAVLSRVRGEVAELTGRRPIYA